jgi:hypothetical protein
MRRIACLTVLLALLAGASTARAEAPPLLRDGIADGVYRGTIAWPGSISVPAPVALQGNWTLHGQLANVVVEGTSIGGEFSWLLNGQSAASTATSSGSGRGTVFGTGSVAGTSQAPCFDGTNRVSAYVEIDGTPYDIEEDLPISCADTRWQLTAMTCSYATGEWTGDAKQDIENIGGSLTGPGTFILWRTGDFSSPEAEDATVDGFLSELDRIFTADTLDGARLTRVLHDVAQYEGNQAVNLSCGARRVEYTRMVGNFLYRLLLRAFSEDRAISLSDLRWMAFAAVNTGQLGRGAFDPARAAALNELFNLELGLLIVQAERDLEIDQLARIDVFATMYGWHGIADQASAAYDRLRARFPSS